MAPNAAGVSFLGSPAAVSRSPSAVDVFLANQNGQAEWVGKNPSWGWLEGAMTNLPGNPMTAPPAVSTEQGTGNVDVLWTDGMNMWYDVWTPANSWSGPADFKFELPSPQSNYGLEGTPAVVSSESGRTDVFAVSRHGELYWWYTTDAWEFTNGPNPGTNQDSIIPLVGPGSDYPVPVITGNVTGSPLAMSRGPGEIEIFYRQSDATLEHLTLTYNGPTSSVTGQENVTAASIQ